MKNLNLKLLLMGLAMGAGVIGHAVEVELLFDNSTNFRTSFYAPTPGVFGPGIREFGDELVLPDKERRLREFHVEYFGDFVPDGDETLKVRIYRNSGALIPVSTTSTTRVPSPGEVIFESEPRPIAPGTNLLSFLELDVEVPDKVTWTATIEGLSGQPGDKVGLVVYSPPTVGSSFNDFWVNVAGQGWKLAQLPGGVLSNFGCRVVVDLTKELEISAPQIVDEGVRFTLNGPIGHSASLEISLNLKDWHLIGSATFTSTAEVVLLDRNSMESGARYYRSALLSDSGQSHIQSYRIGGEENEISIFEIAGPIGNFFNLESSSDLHEWKQVLLDIFPAGLTTIQHQLPDDVSHLFYRITDAVGPQTLFQPTSQFMNEIYVPSLFGPLLRRCQIQVSQDMIQWDVLTTRTFSFRSGALTIVDKESTTADKRFYRCVILED